MAKRPAKSSSFNKLSRSKPHLGLWLGWALVVVLLDQFTKILVTGYYQLGESAVVTSFFNVVRAHNPGAAFSFLADASGWQRWFFTGLAATAALFIVWQLAKHSSQRLFSFALACVLGGALGNLIDRLWLGYVVDFLQFHWPWLDPIFSGGYFPAFNVADSAITLGALCLILDELLRVKKSA
jgi:signal peptidase II